MLKALIASVATALALVPAAFADGGKGASPLRDLQCLAQQELRGPAGRRPVHAEQPAGEERGRDDPAHPAGRFLINEFDYDSGGAALRLFQDNYLSISQSGAAPINYRYRFAAESNTGIPSGLTPTTTTWSAAPTTRTASASYPGQFGIAVYSLLPDRPDRHRTFQKFLWKDMPGAKLPDDPATPAPKDWYSPPS